MKCLADKKTCLGYKDGECISMENCMHKEEKLNTKENIIKRIEENFEDMADALADNNMPLIIRLFRDYTNETIKIIEEELKDEG